jgi:hypothetical protein
MSDLLGAFADISRFAREASDPFGAFVITEQETDCQDRSLRKPFDRGVRQYSCVAVYTRNLGRRTSCYLLGGPRPHPSDRVCERRFDDLVQYFI